MSALIPASYIGILSAMEDGASGAIQPEVCPPPAPTPQGGEGNGAPWFSDLAEPPLAIVILLALGTALFLINLGGYPLYTKGEPREAVTVFDIFSGGGIILPMRAGVEIPSKPLLMHWLAAIVSLIAGGISEWTVRMPSALLAIGGMLACYLYVRRLFNARIGFFSAIILGTSVQYLQAGTGARVDMTLTFFMEVAFFEFIMIAEGLTKRRMMLYLAIALAILAKGPVGLILPGLVALVWIATQGRWGVLRKMRMFRGALLVILLAGGWYVAATMVGGMAFVHKQILAENLFRFFHDSAFHEGHAHPFYYMEGALIAGFMPWSPMLVVLLVQALRRPRRIDPRLAYVIVWFVAVLVFYNLPQSKRGVYLLALYPALATLLAVYLDDASRAPEVAGRWMRWLAEVAAAVFVIAGVIALTGLGMLAFSPHTLGEIFKPFGITDYDFVPQLELAAAAHPFIGMALVAALVAVGVRAARGVVRAERLSLSVTAGMACMVLAANLFVVPALARALTLRTFTEKAMKIVGHDSVGYMGALNYDVAFYSRRDIPVVSIWHGQRPEYLIAWRETYMRLPESVRSQFRAVLLSHPTKLDGSGGMVLLRSRSPTEPAPPKPPTASGSNPPRYNL